MEELQYKSSNREGKFRNLYSSPQGSEEGYNPDYRHIKDYQESYCKMDCLCHRSW